MENLERIENQRIQVCYCGNDKMFPLVLLSALSIAKYTTMPVSLYFITANLTRIQPRYKAFNAPWGAEVLTKALQNGSLESKAEVLDVTECYEKLLGGSKNEKSKYTPYSYLRLLLPELGFKGKMIYLDSDIMCCSDLAQLWNIDLTGYEFAAVRDHMGQFWIGRDYVNSGMLFLNFEEIEKTGLFVRGRDIVKNKRLFFPDQTVLNKYSSNILRLPRKFNEQRQATEGETVIKHFCQGIKWLPFFHVYNIKQSERDKVRKKLKINFFEDVYKQYDELASTYGFAEGVNNGGK